VSGKDSIPIKKGGLFWYTDGSEINEGTEAGMCSYGMNQKFSFSVRSSGVENIKRGYLKRNTCSV
jgi:hypothetical protein